MGLDLDSHLMSYSSDYSGNSQSSTDSFSDSRSDTSSVHERSDGAGSGTTAAYVSAYEEMMNTYLRPFMEVSFEYGGHVKAAAAMFQKACVLLGKFLATASQVEERPDPEVAAPLFRSLFNAMRAVEEHRVVKQHSRWASHMSALSAGDDILIEKTIPNRFLTRVNTQ